ncbi:MAG: cell wall-binding repeat-containing protein, partial [Acidimicrobiales bacterium]
PRPAGGKCDIGAYEASTATVPGAPTNLTATPGNTQVALSWTAPVSDGGSSITGYKIYEGTTAGGEGATPAKTTTGAGTKTTITGLTNGTTYYFTVKAVNAFGISPASSEAPATPTPPPPPVTTPPAPVVTSVSPATGPQTGGSAVTVTGTGLSGATAIDFGTTPGTGVSCTDTSCRVTGQAGTGTVDVTVTTPGGTSATTSADRFTYAAPATTTPVVPTTTREAGINRIATAIAVSRQEFPGAHTAGAVVLARGDLYPDALAGTPLAVAKDAPILLTTSATLSPATLAEIQRVLPTGGTVYLLGGTSALSAGVATTLTSAGFTVKRLSGPNRFGTAVAIAHALGDPSTVLRADGTGVPDALSAGAAAAHVSGAVLLTNEDHMAGATAAYLSAHPGDTLEAIGGPAHTADPSAPSLVGADRYGTSVKVASHYFTDPATVG